MNERLKILVGLSGGVDSSMAAALLLEQGHEVAGLTARMWEGGGASFDQTIEKARRVAGHLGIRHFVNDSTERFGEKVVDIFLAEYCSGRTPSPCILCNEWIKFGHLQYVARHMGYHFLATGHYARIRRDADGFSHLHRGVDARKDQSYFLHRLSQEQLAQALFPLGEMTKDQVRERVGALNLPCRETPESQDLCFIPSGDYAAFLEQQFPDLRRPGLIVDCAGNVLGRHAGVHRFTIGQREGLGVAAATRLYVKSLNVERNEVVLAPREALFSSGCEVDDVKWIVSPPPTGRLECLVRLRYRHEGVLACVERAGATRCTVKFVEPQFAVTPGQAAVFYQGDEVLGGGWILRTD